MNKAYETKDFEEFSAAQEGWDARYRPLQPKAFAARLEVCRMGGIQVDVDAYTCGLEITANTPIDAISIGLPFDVGGSYTASGIDVTTDRIDVYDSACEVHAVTKPRSSILTCCIYKEVIDELADSPLVSTLTDRQNSHEVICSAWRAVDELRLSCARFLELGRAAKIPAQAQARLADETLLAIYIALNAGRDNHSVRQGKRYQIARRARDYMIDRQSDPPNITEICDSIRVSPLTLTYAFQDTYGVSPKRFLKARRLSAAHDALRHAAVNVRVTDIALGLGFWDFSHFAKDYRAMFGETPSATLRRSA